MPLIAACARFKPSPMEAGKAMTGTMENGGGRAPQAPQKAPQKAPAGGWWRIALWGGAAALLALPLAAMRVTDEVVWGPFDFLVFGTMLTLACGAFELAVRARGAWTYRAGAAVAIGASFLLVWVNLAVGFIGNEENPANLMYAGLLAIVIVGGALVRFRPRGMSRVLVAAALAQALAWVVNLVAGLDPRPVMLLIPTAVFMALWLGSAGLFAKAAAREAEA